ncbi:hypothetical protein PENPOL_c002G08802 [Penicillium polonicum]|uniref:Uncharacterized protein n=1 Tax=Penicillium polonicum TaxID=60169 RepID=A0A1V6NWN0_PENPO|nr:hypothetical protein PENPOL_c002G08802 [Penicillium polonicum]
MAAILANPEGLSATRFNPSVAHVLPEANPVPTLPRAFLRKDLLDQEQAQRKTIMKVHPSPASSPCQ